MSAWNCISRSSRDPAAVHAQLGRARGRCRRRSRRSTSRDWNAAASIAARAMCALFTKRVRPTSAPRASGRQYGANSPENAGHEVRAAVVVDRRGEPRRPRSGVDDAEVVAQPLHERAGHGDRALERVVRGLVAAPVGDGRDQPVLASARSRCRCSPAGSCPCRTCSSTRPASNAACPKVAACWSPRMPAIGMPRAAGGSRTSPTTPDDEHDLGQHRPRDAEHLEQLVGPVERREVHQQRAARVRDIGDVDAAARVAGEVPDQPGVGRAEQQIARPRHPRARRARCRGSTRSWMPRSRSPAAGRSWRRTGRRRRRRRAGRCSGCVRVSCQTIALATGRPVRRSHTIAVSRWLVMPTAGEVPRRRAPRRRAPRRSPTACSSRSRSGRARPSRRAGRSARAPAARPRRSPPLASKTIARVEVVP